MNFYGWQGEEIAREFGTRAYCCSQNGQPTRTYYIAHGALLNVMWQPRWENSLGEMDTCVCIAESLHCSPETITTLLIGYTQIQNTSLREKFMTEIIQSWVAISARTSLFLYNFITNVEHWGPNTKQRNTPSWLHCVIFHFLSLTGLSKQPFSFSSSQQSPVKWANNPPEGKKF